MVRFRFVLSLAIVVCALTLGACASKTPLEQLEESRSLYKATLNGFFAQEVPLVEEPAMDEAAEGEAGGEAEEPAAEGTEDGAEGEAVEPVPTRTDVTVDILVQHDAYVPLSGVTVDITMVDGEQNEVARWLRWVDTEGLPKANQKPVSMVFEDVPYQEGYGFHAEVRYPIPPAERGDYREFEGL